MTDDEIKSLREWLTSWGDGPHWADETGATVPITKTALTALLDSADKSRAALRDIRDRVLDHSNGFSTLMRANLATIAGDALE